MKTTISFLSLILISSGIMALSCTRTITSVSSNEMKVEIKISKGDITGIARLAETIPGALNVKYVKSEGGSFNVEDNKVKFIWMSLPVEQDITVSYIVSTEKMIAGDYSISGKFSYLNNGKPADYLLEATSFSVNNNSVEISAENVPASFVAAPVTTANEVSSSSTKKNVLVYKIQVASTAKKLPQDHFKKEYKIWEPVFEESDNGKFKYVVGEFDNINSALDHKEELIKKGIKDPFVLVWLNGKRVTIKEAKEAERTNNQ